MEEKYAERIGHDRFHISDKVVKKSLENAQIAIENCAFYYALGNKIANNIHEEKFCRYLEAFPPVKPCDNCNRYNGEVNIKIQKYVHDS